jgi:hypothetical protein
MNPRQGLARVSSSLNPRVFYCGVMGIVVVDPSFRIWWEMTWEGA